MSTIYLCLPKHTKTLCPTCIPAPNPLSVHFPVILCPASACAGSAASAAEVLTVCAVLLCCSFVLQSFKTEGFEFPCSLDIGVDLCGVVILNEPVLTELYLVENYQVFFPLLKEKRNLHD